MRIPFRFLIICLALLTIFFSSATAGSTETVSAAVSEDGVQKVEVLAGSYFFKPDHIVVRVNTPVELSIRKEWGLIPHTFEAHDPGLGLDVKESLSTEPKVIRFTPHKTGTYEFYCANKFLFFESHREKGMKGVIEVVE